MIKNNQSHFSANFYNTKYYLNHDRWFSYYQQLKKIHQIKPKKILEVGIGNGFLKRMLADEFIIKTFDCNPKLKPDILGDIRQIKLDRNSFDLVCCFQVLEHLPFNQLKICLQELHRVSNKYVLISLPYARIDLKLEFKLPLLGFYRFFSTIPRFYQKHQFDGQHYWEIGKKGFTLKTIKQILELYFTIEKIDNYYDNPYHIFFKLKKNYD